MFQQFITASDEKWQSEIRISIAQNDLMIVGYHLTSLDGVKSMTSDVNVKR